jgi:plastocyanin
MFRSLTQTHCRVAATLFAISAASHASAGDVTVVVVDGGGKPVSNAVVMIDLPSGTAVAPADSYRITQKNLTFQPFVLVIPVGSTVDFSNLDPVRHHVYSFSAAKKFDLKLFGKGESRAVRFDQPGVVAVGCNIHDSMQAFIQVVETRLAVRTGPDGKASLRGAPAGVHIVRIWHPMMRALGNQIKQSINTTLNVNMSVAVKLRRAAPMGHEY